MKKYYITAFDRSGSPLLNEMFEASDDSEAQNIGLKRLSEKQLLHHPSRIVRSSGSLLYFHQ
ncbi:YhzD family protein [Evansella sp. AB-rgal1]|uniref:YhzD family protein n=1 Tax=Evansella sp. AB-rgal1 TaxID=3242696 RepID=UPI00359CEEEB